MFIKKMSSCCKCSSHENEDKIEKGRCGCGPECKCGCQEGGRCDCGPECKCGCQEGGKCGCEMRKKEQPSKCCSKEQCSCGGKKE
ncbi:hypothetical protein CL6EHI_c00175 [Entamoeba histolytica]|uniref:Uncharacterized protein n=1 Tax=Entamoeba histolytica TaxID=5759 RepID=A0A175K1E9_ENTHI|nr:hypothetical protein CL6EHI_c00175 [Entamoeba histolytica]